MRGFLGFLLILALIGGGAWVALDQAWLRIPPNWVPWGRPSLEEQPGWFAPLQINSLAADADACYATLDASKLEYRRLPERPLRNGCGLSAGTEITRSHVPYSSRFQSTCALTAALYWWEDSLSRVAEAELGTGLARIEHVGSYACRNIYGEAEGRISEHATANAIDITGFRFKDGSSVSIERDWNSDSARGRFLLRAHDAACQFFNAVLSPDYNAAHRTHFHLDLGRFRACR